MDQLILMHRILQPSTLMIPHLFFSRIVEDRHMVEMQFIQLMHKIQVFKPLMEI